MADYWLPNEFSLRSSGDPEQLLIFEIGRNGKLEVYVCNGFPDSATVIFPADQTIDILAGMQIWLEQLAATPATNERQLTLWP